MKALNFQFYLVCFILFILTSGCDKSVEGIEGITVNDLNGKLTFSLNGTDLLSYQYDTVYPPEGVDSIFRRSGFIHPLNSPQGQVITQVYPASHNHHFGLWNPWTQVLYDGDVIDFWNLGKGQGTVRFAGLLSQNDETEDKPASIQVLEEHWVLLEGKTKVALNETKTISVSQINENAYALDIDISYQCATNEPFHILEYRYQGMTLRTVPEWTESTSEVFTSQVSSRAGVDGTSDRWCVIQGKLDSADVGVIMMSHMDNYKHPEPLRVWPSGEIMANFCPTKFEDWILEPGNTYEMSYRFYVYNGIMTSEEAETAWQDYTQNNLNP